MLEELTRVAERIGRLIVEDDFPETIRPEELRRAVLDYPSRGGKRLRPALVVWSCGACGGDIEKSLYAAAAIEVFHNWTLVHDDIIDDDSMRRGQPTTHCRFASLYSEAAEGASVSPFIAGRNMAILCGDLQQAWANALLLKSHEAGVPSEVVLALSRRMQEFANRDLITGEAIDTLMPLRDIATVTTEEALEMYTLKTGVLLRFAVECGALIAYGDNNFSRREVCALGEFATAAGVAFQLRDDYLGIFGEEKSFGKALGSDLRSAKPTVLLVTALSRLQSPDREELLGLLRRAVYRDDDIAKAQGLIRKSGAEEAALQLEQEMCAKSRAALSVLPESQYRGYVFDLIDYLISRKK